jgi:hypothetical protein
VRADATGIVEPGRSIEHFDGALLDEVTASTGSASPASIPPSVAPIDQPRRGQAAICHRRLTHRTMSSRCAAVPEEMAVADLRAELERAERARDQLKRDSERAQADDAKAAVEVGRAERRVADLLARIEGL